MEIITTPTAVAEWSARVRKRGTTVGFVPTMGALHEGHLDLVHRARASAGQVVCSIFVNPLQFNNPVDLAHYPRQLDQDRELLAQNGCHALFVPAVDELFQTFTPTNFDLGGLDRCWEGPSRPGHFQGVLNVVERLFHYVRPDKAYFGEKDRQQLTIIRHVARTLRWPEEVVSCPTVRRADGLALSSRNQRLSPSEQQSATVLFRALQVAAGVAFEQPLVTALQAARDMIASEPGVIIDHFGIAHPDTLEPLDDWGELDHAIALVAASVGPVRLIDNMTLVR